VGKFGKLLFRRVVLVPLFILLQIVFMVVVIFRLSDLRPWIQGLMLGLQVLFVLYMVSSPVESSYKIAWILLVMALPVAGLLIYLLMGGNRLSRWERRRMGSLRMMAENNLRETESTRQRLQETSPSAELQSRYLAKTVCSPVYEDTQTEYYPCGELCFLRMKEELRKAKRYIFLEYFIVEEGKMWGELLDILKDKAREGVDVRLIYDDFGCITRLSTRYARRLRDFGISVRVFNPFLPIVSGRLNNRDHRKIMVIDGVAAFTGGINLADEYINANSRFGYWKDAGLFLRGKAAWSMTVQFLSMWNYITREELDFAPYLPQPMPTAGEGFVQPFSDSPLDMEKVGQTVLLNMISRAEKSLYIMTPYLVLDESVTTALCNAAKSGLDVRIVTPGIPDKWYVYALTRANYTALTAAGVQIFEYSPGFLHSKVFLADDVMAVVGTVNLDYRSLYLHFENAVWMYGTDCIASIREDFDRVFPQCRVIDRRAVQETPLYLRAVRSVLNLFAPLM